MCEFSRIREFSSCVKNFLEEVLSFNGMTANFLFSKISSGTFNRLNLNTSLIQVFSSFKFVYTVNEFFSQYKKYFLSSPKKLRRNRRYFDWSTRRHFFRRNHFSGQRMLYRELIVNTFEKHRVFVLVLDKKQWNQC